ncbi:MAG: CFI-box-CTERM domain-containing protein, partial [Candidatus Hodarchaeota archaeon]
YNYPAGTEINITATQEPNYRFSGWTGDVPSGHENDNPITITMDSDKSVTANFIRQYMLNVSVGTGGTTEPAAGTYIYDTGTEVTITATPDTNYRFSGWTGDVPSGHENDNPIIITTDSDKTITANFIRQYTLTITAGTGGTTNPSPGTHNYDVGAQVSVRAIANSGYRFTGWSGDASGTTNPVTINIDSNKSVKANFSRTATGDGGEAGKKGGCFIATAAYGSPLHSRVKILRDFRDKYLMPTKLGRMLVGFYYKNSPFFAVLIAKHKVLKIMVRLSLLPVIVFSYSMLHFGPINTWIMIMVIFAFPIILISFFRRKLRRQKPKA